MSMSGHDVDEMVAAHCREVGMSKHKTAAEWGDRIRDGLKLTMVEVGKLIADLAATEKLAIGGDGTTHFYYRDEYERVVAERDDLRRKLEEAEHEKNLALVGEIGHAHSEGHLSDLVDELRSKLSSASLANAALNGALKEARHFVNGEERRAEIDAALVLPADGLAEEVRWLLANFPNGMDAPIYVEWWKRRTDLLAKLGARP